MGEFSRKIWGSSAENMWGFTNQIWALEWRLFVDDFNQNGNVQASVSPPIMHSGDQHFLGKGSGSSKYLSQTCVQY